jgi:NodT family efflux transporter outer membrane factor (OMF) lipoprotein
MRHEPTSSAPVRRLGVLLALALAGCGLRPDAPSSGLATPARLVAADPAASAAWPEADWWRGFGSPELDALLAAANTASFDVRIAEAQLREADANVRITGQLLLPSGNASFTTNRSQTPLSTASGVPVSGRSRFSQRVLYGAQLSATYEVDFWGRTRNSVLVQQEAAAASRFNIGVVRITTQASVANAYFAVLSAQEQLGIQEANLAVAERVLAVIQSRVAAGTANGLDLAQQQTLVAQQRAAAPPLRQSLEANLYAIGTLAGVVPQGLAMPKMPLAQLRLPPVAPGLPTEVLVRRPDVWLAEANLASAQANVAVARAAMLPTIQLTTTGGFQSLIFDNLLRPGSVLFQLVGNATQPIFQQWQLRAQRDFNQARAEELLETYRKAIVAALVDVETATATLRETTALVALQEAATLSAERANAISEAQFRAGTIDLITLLTTQTTLFNARNQLALARLQRLQAAIGLFRALGGGWS